MPDFHKLPRLFVPTPLKAGASVPLEAGQSHYIRNVMRLGEGKEIRVFDGTNGEFIARIETPGKKETLAILQTQIRRQPSQDRKTHLIFAPIKKTRMDVLVEKAVELGATHLNPVLTERTENRKINPERLEAQIIEALEQCERLIKPVLLPLQKLEKLMAGWKGPQILCCLERQDAPPIGTHLCNNTNDLAFLIGPEGGFSTAEIKLLSGHKACTPVSLGDAILRAETAALYVLSLAGGSFCKNTGTADKIR